MASSRQVRRTMKRLRRVKTWQLVIILVLSGFVTATFLRLNNIGMLQRREAVLLADKQAKDADIATRMYDLQRYSAAHMNADTGQFDLKEQYQRDLEKAVAAATDSSNPNGNVNAKAEAVCRPQFAVWSPAYVQCFLDELNKYPSAPDPGSNVTLPAPALYRHSFVSPLWSRDFAGFSLLFFIAIALVIVGRLAQLGLFYLLLKLRYKSIGS